MSPSCPARRSSQTVSSIASGDTGGTGASPERTVAETEGLPFACINAEPKLWNGDEGDLSELWDVDSEAADLGSDTPEVCPFWKQMQCAHS